MAEHWCKEHKQPFFRKGNMKGFAHPVADDEGEPTGEWCNEPKSDKPTGESPNAERSKEIAEHVWWKELGECIRSKDIDTSKPLGKALRKFYYAKMAHVLGFEFESKGKEEITTE